MPARVGPRSDAAGRVVPQSFPQPDIVRGNWRYRIAPAQLSIVERWGVTLLRSAAVPGPPRRPGDPPWPESPPVHGALRGFASLVSASDARIVEFALKWGTLEVCDHLTPRHDGCLAVEDAATPKTPGFLEPLDTWRRLAQHIQAFRRVVAQLEEQQLAHPESWALLRWGQEEQQLAHPESWALLRWGQGGLHVSPVGLPTPAPLHPTAGELVFAERSLEPPRGFPPARWRQPRPGHAGHAGFAGRPKTSGDAQLRVQAVVNYWLEVAGVSVRLALDSGRLVPTPCFSGLIGALAIGMAGAVVDGRLFVCDECLETYEVDLEKGQRRPSGSGQRHHYCPACRQRYRASDAESKARARLRRVAAGPRVATEAATPVQRPPGPRGLIAR